MTIKWIGALMIVLGCGGVGFSMAAAQKREEKELRQIIAALDYMQCEIQYRLTPLPELCRQAAVQAKGSIQRLLAVLAAELEDQISPDVQHCMNAAISKTTDLTSASVSIANHLGKSLGRFDLDGQIRGLESARQECRRILDRLTENRDIRLRSYQTLGLCAGAALAILFL